MCLYPKLIRNKKYTANKKNGGVIPPVNDIRVLWVSAGCGKCMECKKKKSREWQVRLTEDIKHYKNGKFVTLTYSDPELIKLENEIDQNLKRTRNKQKRTNRHTKSLSTNEYRFLRN